jgi:replicative DNA helicase
MGRYSQNGEPNMDLMLSAWSGERCSIDRQNAAPIILKRPVLTVVAAIQLHTLETLATQKAFAGRGLTARFAYSIPRDVRGHRDVRSSVDLDRDAEDTYNQTLRRLLDHPHDRDRPRDLRVEGRALADFTRFREMMEAGQGEDGDFEEIKGWASKAPGLVLRIAGVLALAEAGRGRDAEISSVIMRRAIELGTYFADHSLRAFEIMGGNTGNPEVDKAWRWISGRQDASLDFTRSDLWQAVKNGRFRVAYDLTAPLDRLVRAGRIARRPVPKTRAGRPPQVWAVNPEALK